MTTASLVSNPSWSPGGGPNVWRCVRRAFSLITTHAGRGRREWRQEEMRSLPGEYHRIPPDLDVLIYSALAKVVPYCHLWPISSSHCVFVVEHVALNVNLVLPRELHLPQCPPHPPLGWGMKICDACVKPCRLLTRFTLHVCCCGWSWSEKEVDGLVRDYEGEIEREEDKVKCLRCSSKTFVSVDALSLLIHDSSPSFEHVYEYLSYHPNIQSYEGGGLVCTVHRTSSLLSPKQKIVYFLFICLFPCDKTILTLTLRGAYGSS